MTQHQENTTNATRALLGAACINADHRALLFSDWRALAEELDVTLTPVEEVGFDRLHDDAGLHSELIDLFSQIDAKLFKLCPRWPEC